ERPRYRSSRASALLQESIPDQVIALGFISALCVPDTALSQSKPGSMWEPGLPAMQAMGVYQKDRVIVHRGQARSYRKAFQIR
ncbi:hypothetical protein KDX30_22770, partial [Pseudomonas sp. CDFA 553]|uniref:hypothetical protein n=1 Tax=Pseudomonas quasicaspiana TaxID=2829821 RepID=UPI001E4EE573